MDILTSFALAHRTQTGEWPKDGIHSLPGEPDYRFTRISPSMYRSTEIPSVGERIRYDFCIWHIRPEKDVLFRVELV